jgi:hypothetical protein
MKAVIRKNVKCGFCLRKDRETYIGGPMDNKRRTYICFECAEVCMHMVLTKKHFEPELSIIKHFPDASDATGSHFIGQTEGGGE